MEKNTLYNFFQRSSLIEAKTNTEINSECTKPNSHDLDLKLISNPSQAQLDGAKRNYPGIGRQRKPCLEWFKTYNWLRFSLSTNKIYCNWCIIGEKNNAVGMVYSEKAFIKDGFDNWKNGVFILKTHNECESHKAAIAHIAAQSAIPVNEQISVFEAKTKERRRNSLIVEIKTIIFLMKQGIPIFRGNNPSNSNFEQTLKLLATSGVEAAKDALTFNVHLSHDIVNEICSIIGKEIQIRIMNRYKEQSTWKYFSILADETRDISGVEQLCFSFRWVNSSLEVIEDVLGLYSLNNIGQTAESISIVLQDILLRCNFDTTLIAGQCYDGANNMSGHEAGAAVLIKKSLQPLIMFIV